MVTDGEVIDGAIHRERSDQPNNQEEVMNEIAHRSYSASQLALIRRTVAKDSNQDEFDLFIEICKQQGLDPFKKQIFAQVYNKDKPDKRQMVVVTSIDGYRAKAQRCGDYRPAEEETRFESDPAMKDPQSNPMGLMRAVVRVFKFGPDKAVVSRRRRGAGGTSSLRWTTAISTGSIPAKYGPTPESQRRRRWRRATRRR